MDQEIKVYFDPEEVEIRIPKEILLDRLDGEKSVWLTIRREHAKQLLGELRELDE